MNVLIETKCNDLDPGLYLKGQGNKGQLKGQSTHMIVSAL